MYTYKFRLYPTKDQQKLLWKHANMLNTLYNSFLHQRIEAYEKYVASGKTIKNKVTKGMQQKELVRLKQEDPSLKEIYSQVLQEVPRRLQFTYDAFFRRVKGKKQAPGFPKYRSCQNFFGICYPQHGFKVADKHIWTGAYGNIKYLQHSKILGNIKRIFITCDNNNKYTVSILTDYNKPKVALSSSIGIDLGTVDLVVATDGTKIKNCTDAKYFDKKIDLLNSRISFLKKGSRKGRYLNRIKKKLCGAKVRKINDFQHKASRKLADKYDTIYAEDLSVKRMLEMNDITVRSRNLQNAKLGQFLSFLKYKVVNLVLVNPKNTSRTCNNCGKIHDIDLSVREITCDCGAVYDRDENAAKNIFCLGQAIQGLDPKCAGSMTIQEALSFTRK